jgi:hypothetical protein
MRATDRTGIAEGLCVKSASHSCETNLPDLIKTGSMLLLMQSVEIRIERERQGCIANVLRPLTGFVVCGPQLLPEEAEHARRQRRTVAPDSEAGGIRHSR